MQAEEIAEVGVQDEEERNSLVHFAASKDGASEHSDADDEDEVPAAGGRGKGVELVR